VLLKACCDADPNDDATRALFARALRHCGLAARAAEVEERETA
jgi:hypothetical protein